MKTRRSLRKLMLFSLLTLTSLTRAVPGFTQTPPALEAFCRDAVSTDPATANRAIHALREQGPDGLRALLTAHAGELEKHSVPLRVISFGPPQPDESWLRLRAALDAVGQQRDCFASGLFWYTDFAKAKAAAQAQNKPILSLRLLGKLNEEFSCANSRFFRTTLYANAAVAQYLSDHFILHWQSVRPVPRVTIDFGDGRKLERTITGNSIHYVLSPDGGVMDALPGLYGAKAFVRGLQRATALTKDASAKSPEERRTLLAAYHQERLAALTAELEQDLQQVSAATATPPPDVSMTPAVLTFAPQPVPMATTAARVAGAKGNVEKPILYRTTPGPTAAPRNDHADFDDATWKKIAARHAEDAILDHGAKTLIQVKGPNALEASRVALSKSFVEDPMLRKLRAMERSISEDTVRNEYVLHRQIHAWLASQPVPAVDQLNSRVYAELFLTPDSDPWLGLLPADAYAALENDGLSLTQKR